MGHYKQIHRGEGDLELLHAELTQLRTQSAQARGELCQLRQEISDFESYYDQTLGRRLADLEELEAEISRYSCSSERQQRPADAATSAGDAQPVAWKSDERDIKSLYREVAKAIHPDLACDGPAAFNRHEMMSKANKAYADEDRKALQEILRNWWQTRAEWDPEWAELVRVKTRIAQERKDVAAVSAEIEVLKGSWAYHFKLRLDTGAGGSHLLADMITAVDLNIERAAKRLAALKPAIGDAHCQEKTAGRSVRFPEDSCGTVYVRDRQSDSYAAWKKAGQAKGVVGIESGKALRLDISISESVKGALLCALQPDDLQALYLFDARDADLQHIVHLAGLEELYVTGVGVTDAALRSISRLKNLKRIYIYHTSISDEGLYHLQHLPVLTGLTSSGNRITGEGLAGFQQAVPRVKTVSFQWKR